MIDEGPNRGGQPAAGRGEIVAVHPGPVAQGMRRSPGVTKTAGLNDLFGGGAQADGVKADLAKQIPAGRIGQTEEIANAVLLLASDDTIYVNAVLLFVDDGMTQI